MNLIRDRDSDPAAPSPGWRGLIKPLRRCGLAGGCYGMVVGSAVGALEHAGRAAGIGGALLAIIGALPLAWYGSVFGAVNRIRFGTLFGGILALVALAVATSAAAGPMRTRLLWRERTWSLAARPDRRRCVPDLPATVSAGAIRARPAVAAGRANLDAGALAEAAED